MCQVGSKLRPRWAMMAPRWSSWPQFGSFWGGPGSIFGHFFRDLWKNGRSVKTTNSPSLLVVFWGLGLGRVLGAMLEDVGSKRVFCDILGDVVASWCQDGAQERQDEAR